MGRATTALYAMLVGLSAVLALPLFLLTGLALEPDRAVPAVDRDSLYALVLPAAAYELHRTELFRALGGSLVDLEENDIRSILRWTFTPEEGAEKLAFLHRSLVNDLEAGQRGRLVLYLPLGDDLPQLVRRLRLALRREMRSLEGCGLGDLLEIGWDVVLKGIFTDRTGQEKLRDLPECDPPGAVEDRIVDGISEKVVSFARENDPARIVPRQDNRIRQAARITGTVRQASAGLLAVTLAATAAVALRLRRSRRELARVVGRPAVASGLLLVLLYLPLHLAGHDLALYERLVGGKAESLSASTAYWVRVVAYAAEAWLARSALHAALAGAALLLLGGLLLLAAARAPRHD